MAKSARARSTCAGGALSERLRRVSSWRSSAVSGRRGSFRWRDMGHLRARGLPRHHTRSHGKRPTSFRVGASGPNTMPSAEALAASRANPEVLGVEEVHMRRSIGIARLSAAFASLLLLSNAAGAQLAVSANDGYTAFVNNTTVGSYQVSEEVTRLGLAGLRQV